MGFKTKTAGIALAVAAAGMLSACNTTSTKEASTGATASTSNVHCYGVNKCAGHNDCKTASNACKGHASCKGQGFVALSAKACDDVGGTVGS